MVDGKKCSAHSTDMSSFVQCKLTTFTLIYRIFHNFSCNFDAFTSKIDNTTLTLDHNLVNRSLMALVKAY